MAAHHPASSVGVRLLDCDHREIGEMFEELDSSLALGQPLQEIGRQLVAIRQITLTHFAMEESMMLATGFPGLDLHRLEHQWLIEQTEALICRARQHGIGGDDPQFRFLVHSHLNHIRYGDGKYGGWLEKTRIAPVREAGSETDTDSDVLMA